MLGISGSPRRNSNTAFLVKEALEALKDMDLTIVISSARTSNYMSPHDIDKRTEVKRMEEYLDKHEIPYDIVLMNDKIPATYYIDDRAIEFKNNWKEIIGRIKKEQKDGNR